MRTLAPLVLAAPFVLVAACSDEATPAAAPPPDAAALTMDGSDADQAPLDVALAPDAGAVSRPDADIASSLDAGAAAMDGGGARAVLDGEDCQSAMDLATASEPTPPGSRFGMRVSGAFGVRDDYNPLDSSDRPPACALVYDAVGPEVVYAISMAPGERLELRYEVRPLTQPGGLYVLDGCNPVSWPDYDESQLCGSNEYVSQGACLPVQCDPLEMDFLYPAALGSAPRTFYVVLDQVAGDRGSDYTLEWSLGRP